MANQSGVRTGEYDGTRKRASWNAIFVGTVILAMVTMLIALGLSASIGRYVINAESEATTPNVADAKRGNTGVRGADTRLLRLRLARPRLQPAA